MRCAWLLLCVLACSGDPPTARVGDTGVFVSLTLGTTNGTLPTETETVDSDTSVSDTPTRPIDTSITTTTGPPLDTGETVDTADTGTGGGITDTPEPVLVTMTLRTNPDSTIVPFADVVSESPANVRIEFSNDDVGTWTTQTSLERGTNVTVPVAGLRGSTRYTLQAVAILSDGRELRSPEVPWVTGVIPDEVRDFAEPGGLVDFRASGDPLRTDGFTIIAPGGSRMLTYLDFRMLVGLDPWGEVVWYRDWSSSHVGPGELVDDGRAIGQVGSGETVVYGPSGALLRTVSDVGGTSVFAMLPTGSVLSMINWRVYIDHPEFGDEQPILGTLLTENPAEGGANTWEWYAHEHLDTSYFPGVLSQTLELDGDRDWLHHSGVAFDMDTEQLLLSFRNVSWVCAVSYPRGSVQWTLGENGDFSLTSGTWFKNQHAATLIDGNRVLLYDNGNEKDPSERFSRAVEYELDFETMTAEEVWAYDLGIYTSSQGDADRLANGNTLVAGAGSRSADMRVVEVTPDGEVVWEINTNPDVTTYRAIRVDWATRVSE